MARGEILKPVNDSEKERVPDSDSLSLKRGNKFAFRSAFRSKLRGVHWKGDVVVVVVVAVVVLVVRSGADGRNRAQGGALIDGSSCPRGEEHRQTAGHL